MLACVRPGEIAGVALRRQGGVEDLEAPLRRIAKVGVIETRDNYFEYAGSA